MNQSYKILALESEIAALPRSQRCDHENDSVADSEGYLGCKECELKRQLRELIKKGNKA